MDNPFRGKTPDPTGFKAELQLAPYSGRDLGDHDPWNYAPDEMLERYLNAKAAGYTPIRFFVTMRRLSTDQPDPIPGILNWIDGGHVAGLFWYDHHWWFPADSPEAAVTLWNQEVAGTSW